MLSNLIMLASTVALTPADFEITSMPGLEGQLNFKQYSGYMPLNDGHGTELFFWFVESQRSPSTDPVALWMNGGPGSSSVAYGFWTEHGPFRLADDGQGSYKPELYPYSWNRIANVIYLEAPAGVGFSFSADESKYHNITDAQSSHDNFLFLQAFFSVFTQFKTNDFYITAESYGGHYGPTLAEQLIDNANDINMKGLLIGNPGINSDWYYNVNQYAWVTFMWSHGLIPAPQYFKAVDACGWNQFFNNCSKDFTHPSPACLDATSKATQRIPSPLDPYNVLVPTCHGNNEGEKFVKEYTPQFYEMTKKLGTNITYNPCISDWTAKYMNRPDVLKAVHADVHYTRKWPNHPAGWYYNEGVEGAKKDIALLYPKFFSKRPTWKQIVVSGTADSAVPFLGTERWMNCLGRPIKKDSYAWKLNKDVAGMVKEWDMITLVTVKGCGHTIPTYCPEKGFAFFENWLTNNWMQNDNVTATAVIEEEDGVNNILNIVILGVVPCIVLICGLIALLWHKRGKNDWLADVGPEQIEAMRNLNIIPGGCVGIEKCGICTLPLENGLCEKHGDGKVKTKAPTPSDAPMPVVRRASKKSFNIIRFEEEAMKDSMATSSIKDTQTDSPVHQPLISLYTSFSSPVATSKIALDMRQANSAPLIVNTSCISIPLEPRHEMEPRGDDDIRLEKVSTAPSTTTAPSITTPSLHLLETPLLTPAASPLIIMSNDSNKSKSKSEAPVPTPPVPAIPSVPTIPALVTPSHLDAPSWKIGLPWASSKRKMHRPPSLISEDKLGASQATPPMVPHPPQAPNGVLYYEDAESAACGECSARRAVQCRDCRAVWCEACLKRHTEPRPAHMQECEHKLNIYFNRCVRCKGAALFGCLGCCDGTWCADCITHHLAEAPNEGRRFLYTDSSSILQYTKYFEHTLDAGAAVVQDPMVAGMLLINETSRLSSSGRTSTLRLSSTRSLGTGSPLLLSTTTHASLASPPYVPRAINPDDL